MRSVKGRSQRGHCVRFACFVEHLLQMQRCLQGIIKTSRPECTQRRQAIDCWTDCADVEVRKAAFLILRLGGLPKNWFRAEGTLLKEDGDTRPAPNCSPERTAAPSDERGVSESLYALGSVNVSGRLCFHLISILSKYISCFCCFVSPLTAGTSGERSTHLIEVLSKQVLVKAVFDNSLATLECSAFIA